MCARCNSSMWKPGLRVCVRNKMVWCLGFALDCERKARLGRDSRRGAFTVNSECVSSLGCAPQNPIGVAEFM